MAIVKLSGSMITANSVTGNNIQDGTITTDDIAEGVSTASPPVITSINYPGDDTAADPAGGQTLSITGNNFSSNALLLIDSQSVTPTSITNTTITFTSPAKSVGSYIIFVVNSDGATAISTPGVQYSTLPAFSTSAGSIANNFEYDIFSTNIAASSDSTITYTLASGSLPSGLTLAANGYISGTLPSMTNATTYTFTVTATDTENQSADRQFNITVNPDAVTWSSPASNTLYSWATGVANTINLSATSVAGKSISYSATGLPDGLSVSGNTITGTPSTVGTYAANVTATAATTSKAATIPLNWSIISAAIAASGGTETTVGGYKYHTFTTSGTFTVTSSPGANVEYLVVGGGGGGGGTDGNGVAGGGAGGYRFGSITPAVQSYSVVVGGGGAAGTSGGGSGGAGGNSSIFSITSAGGGGGSGRYGSAGNGGSGGGASPFYGTVGTGNSPSTSPAQGYNGGGAPASSTTGRPSGGGGGANTAGVAGVAGKAGNGGTGKQWLDGNYYAGGGAGGINSATAGQQGIGYHGGASAVYAGANNGTSGTGGGGAGVGGGNSARAGGLGGSGVVIIRYAV